MIYICFFCRSTQGTPKEDRADQEDWFWLHQEHPVGPFCSEACAAKAGMWGMRGLLYLKYLRWRGEQLADWDAHWRIGTALLLQASTEGCGRHAAVHLNCDDCIKVRVTLVPLMPEASAQIATGAFQTGRD